MLCHSEETLSLGLSKFRNYDPLTTMRVHTQLNYKRKLQVDQAVVVKTGSTFNKCTLGSHDRNYVHGMQTLAAAKTQKSIDPEAHGNWRGHS